MSVNPALLGTLVALQGSNLNQRDRTTAVATGLALGGANLVAGFMVGRGAVAESSLANEKSVSAELRAKHELVQQENEALRKEKSALSAKLAHSQALANTLRALPEDVRKKLPADQVEPFLSSFPAQAVVEQREVESSGKSSSPHVHAG